MDNMTKISSTALERYFHTLSVFGYKSYDDVGKLIVLLFLEEILDSELGEFVTEEDYRTIINVLYCLMGNSCLIDIPSYSTWDSLYHNNPNYLQYVRYRISEDNTLRADENGELRIEE